MMSFKPTAVTGACDVDEISGLDGVRVWRGENEWLDFMRGCGDGMFDGYCVSCGVWQLIATACHYIVNICDILCHHYNSDLTSSESSSRVVKETADGALHLDAEPPRDKQTRSTCK